MNGFSFGAAVRISFLCALSTWLVFAGTAGAQEDFLPDSLVAPPSDEISASESVQSLRLRFLEALQRKDWIFARMLGERVVTVDPKDQLMFYNLACVEALTGNRDRAFERLTAATAVGFEEAGHTTRDPDLTSLREDPRFRTALEGMRRNRARSFENFKSEASAMKPSVFVPEALELTKPVRLIVALHGFGANGADIASAWQETATETKSIVVAPDAVRIAGDGYEWRFPEEAEWLVLHTIEEIRKSYAIDEREILLTGFSQGAAMALDIGVRHPELFRGLIAIAGGLDPGFDWSVVPSGPRPRIALRVGGADRILPLVRDSEARLLDKGYEVSSQVYPDLPHSFPPDTVLELKRAIEFVRAR